MKFLLHNPGLRLFLSAMAFLGILAVTETKGLNLMYFVLGAVGIWLFVSATRQFVSITFRPSHVLYSKDRLLKFTATLMGLFLVTGTLLYIKTFSTISNSVTYEVTGEIHQVKFNNVELFLRSLVCSLNLFMLNLDSNILDRLDNHATIKDLISLQAAASFSCTVFMLLILVYSRFSSYIKLAFKTKIDKSHNHLYLFFGVNEPSELLIKKIQEQNPDNPDEPNDPNAVIILIDEANLSDERANEWDEIISLLTHRHQTLRIVDKYSVRIAKASKRLCNIDKETSADQNFDAFDHLGLKNITKIINKLKQFEGSQLHIFFLDENEDRNISNIITLANDKTIRSLAESKIKHKIYCHARFNGPNRVIQDVAVKNRLNIDIVDSSHLAIERLKLLPQFHPLNVVELNPENPATVNGAFNALIVGFGEVGQDAFKFLYEFSAFVADDATATDARRCGFNCTIVDQNLHSLQGEFKASMPGIFNKAPEGVNINFQAIDFHNEEFYTEILNEKTIASLNYVIISINDADEAIALAARIFSRFRQYGGNPEKMLILARCIDDSKVEALQKIADHYNYGYGKGKENKPVIHLFGQPEETYTYQLVISNRLTELGMQFQENYRIIKGEGPTWKERYNDLTKGSVPNIDKLRKLRRQESQDRADALHMSTKMALLTAAIPQPIDWQGFRARYFKSDGKANRTGTKADITYTGLLPHENLIILRLAMLEHLRWNAAHELLGYVVRTDGIPSCDETTMRHNCLIPWSELDQESERTRSGGKFYDYKEFDFTVVDTTIALSIPETKPDTDKQ